MDINQDQSQGSEQKWIYEFVQKVLNRSRYMIINKYPNSGPELAWVYGYKQGCKPRF